MEHEKVGKALTLMTVLAVIGFIAAIYFLVMAAIWLYNHINII